MLTEHSQQLLRYALAAYQAETEGVPPLSESQRQFVLHPGLVRSASDGDTHYIDAVALLRLYGVRGPERDHAVIAGTGRAKNLADYESVVAVDFQRDLVHLWPDPLGKYDLEHPFDPTGKPPRFKTTEEADAWLEQRARVLRIQRGEGDLGEQGRAVSAPPGAVLPGGGLVDPAMSRDEFRRRLLGVAQQPSPILQSGTALFDAMGAAANDAARSFQQLVDQQIFDALGAAVKPDFVKPQQPDPTDPTKPLKLSGAFDTVTLNGKTYRLRDSQFTDDGVTFTVDDPPNTIS